MKIPLNIVMTYPVHWNKYEVLRDFIQNFYDSVDVGQWHDLFQYEYNESRLTMYISGVKFSYEWLMHIGASTKTGAADQNAGYFGEGFKIASLCAIRDFHWTVQMSSSDWMLDVISIGQTIDNTQVQMLAYDLSTGTDLDESRLTLYPISEADYHLFEVVINSFYFPENELFGEKLWEGRRGAVYTRGKGEYYPELRATPEFGRKGTVFCAFQLLGSNPFDLAVCLHSFRRDDRERRSLYTFQVIDVFEDVSYSIDAYGAMRMLEKMRRNWNSVPSKRIDIHSWYPVICNLIERIRGSPEITNRFREKYPNLLCLPPLYSLHDKNRRAQARAWLSFQDQNYLLVQRNFKRLGYETLEDACERNGGFVINDLPDEREQAAFEVIEGLVREIYGGFFLYADSLPQRRIIRNERASYHGMALVFKRKKPLFNNYGVTVRYDIGEIYLKQSIFTSRSISRK